MSVRPFVRLFVRNQNPYTAKKQYFTLPLSSTPLTTSYTSPHTTYTHNLYNHSCHHFTTCTLSVAKATLQPQMSVRPFVRPFVRNQNPYTAKNQSVHLKTTFTTTHNITHTISLITLTASHTPLHSSHSQHHTHTITLITLTTSHTSPHTCTTIIHTTITYTNVTTTLSIRVGEKR